MVKRDLEPLNFQKKVMVKLVQASRMMKQILNNSRSGLR